MAEVIERNTGSQVCRCQNCDSLIKFMPSEIFTEKRNRDYLGDYDIAYVIKCPACGETTHTSNK